jgi:diguanylate cyclase (GGDEF)-like protein
LDARDLDKEIQLDLARRSLQGVWAQPVITLIAFGTTDIALRAPRLTWVACTLLTAVTLLRFFLLKRQTAVLALDSTPGKVLHIALIMFFAAFWGFMAGFAVHTWGFHDEDAFIFVLCHAGVALGMTTLLMHDLFLLHLCLTLMYLPLLTAQVVSGGDHHWGLTLTCVAYLFYILVLGSKLHKSWWRQISDNYDLHAIARHDALTRLPNRLYLLELMDAALVHARAGQCRLALLYIDLDGFKQVNDRYSHRIGDLLLCEIANRLTACVQSQGVVARLGGDEFTILITECGSTDQIAALADCVLNATRRPCQIEGLALVCSASIGVSLFPADADTSDHLMRAADMAMYVAKSSGKNQLRFASAIEENAPALHIS